MKGRATNLVFLYLDLSTVSVCYVHCCASDAGSVSFGLYHITARIFMRILVMFTEIANTPFVYKAEKSKNTKKKNFAAVCLYFCVILCFFFRIYFLYCED